MEIYLIAGAIALMMTVCILFYIAIRFLCNDIADKVAEKLRHDK